MSVAAPLSKRERRLLTLALKTTVSRTPKSEGVFDRLVNAGYLDPSGRGTAAGRRAIYPEESQHEPSNDFGAGIDVDRSHKSKYQSGDRRHGTRC